MYLFSGKSTSSSLAITTPPNTAGAGRPNSQRSRGLLSLGMLEGGNLASCRERKAKGPLPLVTEPN